GAPGRVVVAGGPAPGRARGRLARAVVDPVLLRLVIGRAKDRPLDRLDGGGLGGGGGGSGAWSGRARRQGGSPGYRSSINSSTVSPASRMIARSVPLAM